MWGASWVTMSWMEIVPWRGCSPVGRPISSVRPTGGNDERHFCAGQSDRQDSRGVLRSPRCWFLGADHPLLRLLSPLILREVGAVCVERPRTRWLCHLHAAAIALAALYRSGVGSYPMNVIGLLGMLRSGEMDSGPHLSFVARFAFPVFTLLVVPGAAALGGYAGSKVGTKWN